MSDDWMIPGIIVLVIVLVVAGLYFSQHQISEGVVVEKRILAPYTSLMLVGKVMIPIAHPESYEVDVKGLTQEGVERVEAFTVGKDDFDALRVGDRFTER